MEGIDLSSARTQHLGQSGSGSDCDRVGGEAAQAGSMAGSGFRITPQVFHVSTVDNIENLDSAADSQDRHVAGNGAFQEAGFEIITSSVDRPSQALVTVVELGVDVPSTCQ